MRCVTISCSLQSFAHYKRKLIQYNPLTSPFVPSPTFPLAFNVDILQLQLHYNITIHHQLLPFLLHPSPQVSNLALVNLLPFTVQSSPHRSIILNAKSNAAGEKGYVKIFAGLSRASKDPVRSYPSRILNGLSMEWRPDSAAVLCYVRNDVDRLLAKQVLRLS